MENIDLIYLKKLTLYSLIFGAVFGLFSVIPFVMPVCSLFVVPFLGCIVPFILLFKLDGFYTENIKTYAILGAISGFFITIAFYFVFIPLCYIIHLIFKTSYYDYGIHYLNLFLFFMFFVMIAFLYVIINSVTGLLTGICYKFIKDKINV